MKRNILSTIANNLLKLEKNKLDKNIVLRYNIGNNGGNHGNKYKKRGYGKSFQKEKYYENYKKTQKSYKKAQTQIRYPTFQDILDINIAVTGGRGVPLFPDGQGKIESAIARMQSSYFDVDLYPCLFSKAASLLHSIVTTHPFQDANKRTGTLTALQFLYDNGLSYNHDVSDKEMEMVVMKLANNEMSQEKLFSWIKEKFEKHIGEKSNEEKDEEDNETEDQSVLDEIRLYEEET